jgi:hypothetical protein
MKSKRYGAYQPVHCTFKRMARPLQLFLAATIFLTATLRASSADAVTIQNQTYPAGQTATIVANSTITAGTNVTVSSSASITYVAGTRVTLSPGFRAASGSTFRAYAGDADGDGMPDSWEMAMFGSTSASPTADADGDGLDNLTEFYLGTNPTIANATDGSNQSQLKVHRPIQ